MKRALLPFAKSLFLSLLAVSAIASANEAKPAAAVAKPDAAKGAILYTNGDAARSIPACVACHGDAGNSTAAANPKLSAQHAEYLAKQLHDFTTPQRNNAVMSSTAKALSAEDVLNVSAYLASQKPKQGTAKNKDTIDLGKKIFRGGIAEKNVPACAACHGAAGGGIPSQYPRLAGQHGDYTVTQLTAFSKGIRKNSAPMVTIAKRMSEDEMKAVADYIAGLK